MKNILKFVAIGIFLYIAFFSIQNFYQGYHDIDIAFNFLHLGMTGDIATDGTYTMLNNTYLRGMGRITSSFVWLCLDCIFGVYIGIIFFRGVKC